MNYYVAYGIDKAIEQIIDYVEIQEHEERRLMKKANEEPELPDNLYGQI